MNKTIKIEYDDVSSSVNVPFQLYLNGEYNITNAYDGFSIGASGAIISIKVVI